MRRPGSTPTGSSPWCRIPDSLGTIPLLVGVRDQVNRGAATLDNAASNYQWHTLTLTVNPTATPVNLVPIALPVTAAATTNTPTTIQLNGNHGQPRLNPDAQLHDRHPARPRDDCTPINAASGTVTYTSNVRLCWPRQLHLHGD